MMSKQQVTLPPDSGPWLPIDAQRFRNFWRGLVAKEHGEDAVIQPSVADVEAWRELEANEEEYREHIRAEAIRLRLIDPPNPLITLTDETNAEMQQRLAEGLARQTENGIRRAIQEQNSGGYVRPGGIR